MSNKKPRRSVEEIEDVIIRKIFSVTSTDSMQINADLMEQVLIDRLSGDFTSSEPLFSYLVNCYRRAYDEGKKIVNMKDINVRSQMELVVKQAKKLAVSYARIHLGNPDMFGGSSELNKSSLSPLLPLVFAEVATSVDGFGAKSSEVASPPGFLHEFFGDADYDSLEPIMEQLYKDLRGSVTNVSALGNFQQPLRALLFLCSFPLGAKSLVSHQFWVPKGDYMNGRAVEMTSILGPFFHVSALPDHIAFKSYPDVGQECFLEASKHHSVDVISPLTMIKTVMNNLQGGLAEVLLCLLKKSESRECVLQYFGEVINKNASRAHMKVDPLSSASSGMFVNLSAVMLRLSEPFLDANLTKRDKIDPNYIFHTARLDLRSLTALNASSEEISEWLNKKDIRISDDGGAKPKYTFICECFFMTARVLNLGLLKAFSEYKHLNQEIARCEDTLNSLRDMEVQSPSPQLNQDIALLEKEFESLSQGRRCYEAQIFEDKDLIQRALSFYRLMMVWLLDICGGFKMPLPSTCPMEFASIPEHFVEDAMDFLKVASRIPGALDRVPLDDFMNFIIMFMASPNWIRNPYLRAKMVKVLICLMPRRSVPAAAANFFEGNQLSQNLVRNLLKLYVDIEFTGSHTQFYDKFNIRHNIAELLEYLWKVPVHRNAWRQIAKEEEKGVYLNFLNFLINDSIFLLDESLKKILELKKLEDEMSNTIEWERRPPHERQEKTRLFHSQENILRFDMKLADEDVRMLSTTSELITSPFLLPEMVERVASMLNYFLLQLVGPKRKALTLRDPEKYEFHPKKLLKQIVNIYVHLARGDTDEIFASAIITDGRSYNEQLFTAAANVLKRIGEDRGVIEEFVKLGEKAKLAALEAMDAEAALGEIPDEFLDPIQYTLMKDPVILPSSRINIDRPVIQRHLLSNTTDPFNRSHLTVGMLIPNTELKVKIQEFVRSQGSNRRTEKIN